MATQPAPATAETGELDATWRSDKAHEAICEATERIANHYCDEDDTYFPEVKRLTVAFSNAVDNVYSHAALLREREALRTVIVATVADLDSKRLERCTYCRKGFEWSTENQQHIFHCASPKFDGQLLDCMAHELRLMAEPLRTALGDNG